MLIIVGGILASVIMLTCVVFCLYFKVSRALRAAMEADDVAENCHNLAKITESKCLHNKFARAKTTTTESCRALQCCDECGIYADFDPLPPCYCDINEGL
ncbi:Protein FAM24A [Tupaia chinensis]|uniref:Protein FAM24A n=2 Tax=Tupaia chinensis TaxID=246437 RepID=L9L4N2_TUPCH|nr:Protein FAM24A [Tupaia chinensis]